LLERHSKQKEEELNFNLKILKREMTSSNVLTRNSSSSIVSWLLFGGKLVGGLLLTLTVVLYFNQEKLLYHPNPPGTPKKPEENPEGCKAPSEWNKKGYSMYDPRRADEADPIPFEDVLVETVDGEKIHTWLLLQDNAEYVPTLIYFHGNAANMGFRLQNAADMYGISKLNILMMDYRGYGKSTGVPTEKGLQLDGEAVLNYALKHPRLSKSPMVVFGRSLGGAVCMYLAEKFPSEVAAVIVENTFLSVGAMVDILLPFLRPLKPYVLKIKWDNDRKIPQVKQPILFISGDSDQLVPPFHMKQLYELATSSARKEMYSVSGGTHNDTWYRAGKAYYRKLKEFLAPFFLEPSLSANVCVEDTNKTAAAPAVDNSEPQDNRDEGEPPTDEEEDYLLVQPTIPTMGKSFNIH
jgi:hypothetical protein